MRKEVCQDEGVLEDEDERLWPRQKKPGCPVAPYRVLRGQPSRIERAPGTLRSEPGPARNLPREAYGRALAVGGDRTAS